MKNFIALALATFLLLMCGCNSSVSLDAPVGTQISQDQKQSTAGRWATEDGDVIEIRLGSDGAVYLGQTDWDDDAMKFVARTCKIDLRLIGESLIVFAEDAGRYGFARIAIPSSECIILSLPDSDAFREAVKSGELDGKVIVDSSRHDHVQLSSMDDVLPAILGDVGDTAYFPGKLSQKMRRLKRFDAEPVPVLDERGG